MGAASGNELNPREYGRGGVFWARDIVSPSKVCGGKKVRKQLRSKLPFSVKGVEGIVTPLRERGAEELPRPGAKS